MAGQRPGEVELEALHAAGPGLRVKLAKLLRQQQVGLQRL